MPHLRIGINALFLRPGQVGGSEIYLRALVRHLTRLDRAHVVIFASPKVGASFEPRERATVVPIPMEDFRQARRLWAENVVLPQAVRDAGVDVLLSPGNFGVLAPLPCPQVVVVHDLQHQWLKENFPLRRRLARSAMFRASFRRAARVIAVSDFTRRDLLRTFKLDPASIVTVLEGHDPEERVAPDIARVAVARLGIDEPYFYYPATTEPHKNHETLLRAFARVRASAPGAQLVLTGPRTERYEKIMAEARRLGIARAVHHLGHVTRAEVMSLHERASALVYPSRFEGFGLPILEAQSTETPVIGSTSGSIPEVAGAGAVLLDPDDAEAWATEMLSILRDASKRQQLAAAGTANLSRFSWVAAAAETLHVLLAATEMKP